MINIKKEHIVRVGPVHAGIIEPGVFNFTCVGERVQKLEISLGFQHRGIEKLIVEAAGQGDALKMMCLAEQIAGDTSVGHALAMAQILDCSKCSDLLVLEREVALELERAAVNTGDVAALAGDIAHQSAHVACEALRTLLINATQRLCGSRFGRTLIRPSGTNFPITAQRCDDITSTVKRVRKRLRAVRASLMNSPSVLSRLEEVCVMEKGCGRYSGDLKERLDIRFRENEEAFEKIIENCKVLKSNWFEPRGEVDYTLRLEPSRTYASEVRGWRGTIKHSCRVDESGVIVEYHIEDPSAVLWDELARSTAGAEIADFPVNNKSFNLSYCGTDK